MSMTCKVCPHPQRAEIEADVAHGVPLRAVARRYGPSRNSVTHHTNVCLAAHFEARAAIQSAQKESLADVVARMRERLQASFARRSDVDVDEMSMGDLSKETARLIELEAKLTGQIAPKRQADAGQMTAAEQLAYVDRMRPLLLEAAAKEAAEMMTVVEMPK